MSEERVLVLDISSKTGWAAMISGSTLFLLDYGTLDQIHEPAGAYPASYVDWAYSCFSEIEKLIDSYAPDTLVIEETCAGSKSVYSQKFLEWTHFLLAKFIKETRIKAIYLLTGQWRVETDCRMTKEESKHNKDVKVYKEENDSKIAYNANGKRIGKLTKKHINIRRANEVFKDFLRSPLKRKDEDQADALLLGYAYHLRRIKNEQRHLGK